MQNQFNQHIYFKRANIMTLKAQNDLVIAVIHRWQ